MRYLLTGLAVLVIGCTSPSPSPEASSSVEAPTASPTITTEPSPSALAYTLSCGPLDQTACGARAAIMVKAAIERYPGAKVVAVRITSEDGDSELVLEDGTTLGVDVN